MLLNKKIKFNRVNLLAEALEPRLLLSADGLAVLAEANIAAAEELVISDNEINTLIVQNHTEQSSLVVQTKQYSSELVILDSRVPNFQQLHNDIIMAQQQGRNINVIVLDVHRDGLEQIYEALTKYNNLGALHIVSHGESGKLQLGATQLDKHTLQHRSEEIQQWQAAFIESGDLLLYGCNLAGTSNGQTLVNELAKHTATDVAASDDLTGNSLLGGDWDLEYQTGEIETSLVFSDNVQKNWQGALNSAPVITNNDLAIAINYTENDTATILFANATVFDSDGLDYKNGTLTVSFSAGGTINDGLSIIENATVTVGSNNNIRVNGNLVGNFIGGTDGTPLVIDWDNNTFDADVQTVLQQIAYHSNSESPNINPRTIDFVLTDGDGGTSNTVQQTVTVTSVNDNPLLVANAELNLAHGVTELIPNTLLYVTDLDNTAEEITYTLTDAPGYGTLKLSGTVLGASDTFTQDDINTERLTYVHTDLSMTPDSFAFTAVDGAGGTLDSTVFNIKVLVDPEGNDAPVLSMTGPPINYTENDPATILDATATVVDVDSDKFTGGIMTVSFSSISTVNDELSIIQSDLIVLDNGGIKVNNNVVGFFLGGTGGADLVIDWGNATSADVQAVLQNIAYRNTSDNPDITPRTIDFVTSDGDGGTSNIVQQIVNITSVPDAPTAVTISPGSIAENTDTSSGISVGTLSSIDPDSSAPFTYEIVGGVDVDVFVLGGTSFDELILTDGTPDHEIKPAYEVIVKSTDDTGLSFEQTLTITVSDENEYDPIASDASFNVDENSINGTSVGTVVASDADTSQILSYAITEGNGSGAFTINATSGEITVANGALLDYETTTQYVLTVLVTDSVATIRSDTATITINLNNTNDAPVLTGANNLTSINEDPVSNNGTLVSTLLAGHVTDADSGGSFGIAVTAVDNTSGSWEYSLNGGSSWQAFGSADESAARLLASDANTYVRFVPNENWNGTTTDGITFRAWDQSIGTAGNTVDLTHVETETVLDNFDNVSFINNDGTVNWSNDWTEIVESDGISNGDVRINNKTSLLSSNELSIGSDQLGEGITRGVDLSGAASASLSFNYVCESGTGSIDLEIFDGSNWQLLNTFTLIDDTVAQNYSVDISAFADASSQIRFIVSSADPSGRFFADNVQISYTTSTVGITTAFSSMTASSSITVNAVDDAAVVGGVISYIGSEGDVVGGTMTATDVDGLTDTTYFTVSTPASNGTATINAETGAWTFVPGDSNWFGSDSFTVTVTDDQGGTTTQVVSVTLTNVEDEAVIGGDLSASDNEGVTVGGTMTATDVDGLTDTTYFTVSTPASNGTATINAETGAWTFVPGDSNWFGSDSFTVTVSDDQGGTTTQVVNISLANVNDPAIIDGVDTGGITEDVDPDLDTLLETSGSLTITDIETGEASFNAGVYGGVYGVITLNAAGDWDYAANNTQATIQTLAAGATIIDTITVSSVDGTTHDINITITGSNDVPVAGNDAVNVNEGASVIIDVIATDSDIDNALDLNSIVITGAPVNGSYTVNGDGTVTYNHDGSETLSDSFTYTITDISGAISNTAIVNIIVTPVNDLPVALDDNPAMVNQGDTAIFDLAANDSDSDNALDLNSIVITGAPANGSLIVNGDGTVSYTHNGSPIISDSFSYTISDISGAISKVATVNVTVNSAPTVTAISDVTVTEDSAATGIDLNAAFDDADNPDSELTYSITGNTNIGLFSSAAVNAITGEFVLDYAADMSGSSQISIRASDPSGASVNTLFTVTVTPVNDRPVLVSNAGMTVAEANNTAISNTELNVNDIDNINTEIVYIVTELPINGELLINGIVATVNSSFTEADIINNSVSYQSYESAINDQFTFLVSDGAGGTITAKSFNITVQLALPLPEVDTTIVETGPSPDPVDTATTSDPGDYEDPLQADVSGKADSERESWYVGSNRAGAQQAEPQPLELTSEHTLQEVVQDGFDYFDVPVETSKSDIYKLSTATGVADLQLKSIKALWTAVDQIKQQIDRNISEDMTQLEFRAAAISSSGVTLTAGVVAWVLRGGALMTSLMGTVPLWKAYDPLPILAYREDEDEEENITADKIPVSLEEMKKIKAMKEKMEKYNQVDALFGGSKSVE